jgi:hypothetical protein
METKACTKCGIVKTLDKFSKCSSAKDGKNYQCKDCVNEYQRNRNLRPENREKLRKANKKYLANLKENDPHKYEIVKAKMDKAARKHQKENPKAHYVSMQKYRQSDKGREAYRRKNKKATDELADFYIHMILRNAYGITIEDSKANPHLIELKRAIIKFNRYEKTI